MNAITNLTRVTGMGRIAAEAFVRTCDEAEIALLDAGSVQQALDAQADRLSRTKAAAAIIQTSPAGEPVSSSPAPTVSEAVDDDEDQP